MVTGSECGIDFEIAKGFEKCSANIVVAGIMNEEISNIDKVMTAETLGIFGFVKAALIKWFVLKSAIKISHIVH